MKPLFENLPEQEKKQKKTWYARNDFKLSSDVLNFLIKLDGAGVTPENIKVSFIASSHVMWSSVFYYHYQSV